MYTTGNDLYLIEFKNSSYKDLCEWQEIQNSLKKLNDKYYLSNIYRFDRSKHKFIKVPKKDYKLLFSANTEAILILEKHNLI